MLKIMHQENGFVEMAADGYLKKADFEEVVPQLEEKLTEDGEMSALIILHDFHGWTPSAALEDIRFALAHRTEFSRVAVVGESRLAEWAIKLTAPFFSGEVQFYEREPGALEEARSWARSGVALSVAVY